MPHAATDEHLPHRVRRATDSAKGPHRQSLERPALPASTSRAFVEAQ